MNPHQTCRQRTRGVLPAGARSMRGSGREPLGDIDPADTTYNPFGDSLPAVLSTRRGPFRSYRCVRITRYQHSSPSYRHVHGALRAPTNINNCMERSLQLHHSTAIICAFSGRLLMTRKFYEHFSGVTSEAPGSGIGRVSYLIYVSMRHYVLTTSGGIRQCLSC